MRQRGKLEVVPVMPEEQYRAEMKRALDSYIHAGATDHPEYAKAKAQFEQHNIRRGK